MTRSLSIELKTLTPLWTGDVQGNANRGIQVTGLLGSMRWWYEALVRGVGGRVCNPMGSAPYRPPNRQGPDNPAGKCLLDSKQLPDVLSTQPDDRRRELYQAGLCDVCQVFGTTGWRRRFRMRADDTQISAAGPQGKLTADGPRTAYRWGEEQSEPPAWYFKTQGLGGTIEIHLWPTGEEDVSPIIAGLLQFMADWSALGARSQLGFGVVTLKEASDTAALYDRLVLLADDRPSHYDEFPGLHNMFFAQVAAPSDSWKEVVNLKYDLRQLFSGSSQRNLRHRLFGTVFGGTRRASKINVSAPYGDEPVMRVWGWVPAPDESSTSTPKIFDHLSGLDADLTWRELDSPRDTEKRHQDPLDFVADLLGVSP